MTKKIFILTLILLGGCVNIPDTLTPVSNFNLDRYLGTWHEIVRLDHSFERGLEKVSAQYTPRDDGGVKVVNRGFDPVKNKWKEAVGKAYFVESSDTGRLKVSFFGPFYGGYNIIELDQKEYSYAVVCGSKKSYLWILAREPYMDKALLDKLILKVKNYGFKTDELIYVKH
ncbi:lipocalin family protein [Thermodesulfobacteriota bacterium]